METHHIGYTAYKPAEIYKLSHIFQTVCAMYDACTGAGSNGQSAQCTGLAPSPHTGPALNGPYAQYSRFRKVSAPAAPHRKIRQVSVNLHHFEFFFVFLLMGVKKVEQMSNIR